MIKKLVFLAVFFAANFAFSQSSHDSRLLEKYSEQELTELKNSEPAEYKTLVNALEKGIFIGEIPTEKDIQFDGELEIDPDKEHTFISLGIELREKHYQYYKITGTNMMVGVLPKSLLK